MRNLSSIYFWWPRENVRFGRKRQARRREVDEGETRTRSCTFTCVMSFLSQPKKQQHLRDEDIWDWVMRYTSRWRCRYAIRRRPFAKKETQVYFEFFIFWEREKKYLRTWDTKTLEENDFLFVSPLLIGITISCVVVQEDSPLSPPVIPFLLSFDRCLFCLFWNKRKCLWFPTCVGPICFGYRHRHRVAERKKRTKCASLVKRWRQRRRRQRERYERISLISIGRSDVFNEKTWNCRPAPTGQFFFCFFFSILFWTVFDNLK
jgi:hypothetical protein